MYTTAQGVTRLSTVGLRSVVVLLAWVAMATTAEAQSASPAGTEPEPVRTLEQKTERIVHQDAGSRIEELRVGGQTRRIEVDTPSGVPGYQIEPVDPSQMNEARGSGAGKSSWRLIRF